MGYRSEVVCTFVFQDELVRDAFHTTAMSRFCDTVPSWSALDQEWFINAFEASKSHGNYVLTMKFEDIKWYPEFEIPKFVSKEMMPECVERGGAYAYARIGEEQGDVEMLSEYHTSFEDFDESEYVRVNSYIEVG